MGHRISARWISLLGLSLFTAVVIAEGAERSLNQPFASANRNPFVLVSGLPAVQSADLLGSGQHTLRGQTELANTATRSRSGDQQIILDGETLYTAIDWQYGWREHWQVGIMLPWLRHSGGQLDSVIAGWHELFGLPNGERDAHPDDILDFQYREGSEGIALQQPVDGSGDLQLQLAYQLGAVDNQQSSVRASLKLPTGDADQLTGSGGTELAFSLQHSHYRWRRWLDDDWHWHYSAGLLLSERGEVLAERRQPLVIFGSTTLVWQWSPQLALKLQLDGHSALYDSRFRELGNSVQLLVGGALMLAENWTLDLAVSEDLVVATAPDVTFLLTLRWQPD